MCLVKRFVRVGIRVDFDEFDADVMGFVSDEDTMRRLRGKLCRANPMSAIGMKQGHRVI
jgi:hypothetical protein